MVVYDIGESCTEEFKSVPNQSKAVNRLDKKKKASEVTDIC